MVDFDVIIHKSFKMDCHLNRLSYDEHLNKRKIVFSKCNQFIRYHYMFFDDYLHRQNDPLYVFAYLCVIVLIYYLIIHVVWLPIINQELVPGINHLNTKQM